MTAEELHPKELVSFKELVMANSIQVDALCQAHTCYLMRVNLVEAITGLASLQRLKNGTEKLAKAGNTNTAVGIMAQPNSRLTDKLSTQRIPIDKSGQKSKRSFNPQISLHHRIQGKTLTL
jgi:hypothetical protein